MDADLNAALNSNYVSLNQIDTKTSSITNIESDNNCNSTFYSVEYSDMQDYCENDIESILLCRSSAELCRICFEYEDREMVELPCKHHICSICKDLIKKKECPFCRKYYGPPKKNTTRNTINTTTQSNTQNTTSNSSCSPHRIINCFILYACLLFTFYFFLRNIY